MPVLGPRWTGRDETLDCKRRSAVQNESGLECRQKHVTEHVKPQQILLSCIRGSDRGGEEGDAAMLVVVLLASCCCLLLPLFLLLLAPVLLAVAAAAADARRGEAYRKPLVIVP